MCSDSCTLELVYLLARDLLAITVKALVFNTGEESDGHALNVLLLALYLRPWGNVYSNDFLSIFGKCLGWVGMKCNTLSSAASCNACASIQRFGVSKIFKYFWKSLFWSPWLHLFNQRYNKTVILWNIITGQYTVKIQGWWAFNKTFKEVPVIGFAKVFQVACIKFLKVWGTK